MSTNMTLITSVTVGSGGAASVTLPATGTIPQTYTDLKILCSTKTNRGTFNNDAILLNLNGSTSSITAIRLFGDGSSVASNTDRGIFNNAAASTNVFANTEIYIPNYTSSNYKSISADTVTENNGTEAYASLHAQLWSNTAAVTTAQLVPADGTLFLEGSTFYLYGISNVTSTTKATGGIVSSDGTYNYHMFPYSGTFTPTENITADYLVIAGGGGGAAGGGGAGGLRSTVGTTGGGGSLESALSLTANTAYTVTVGAGGAGGISYGGGAGKGVNGGNSVFSTITSTGGGGGGAAGGPDVGNGGSGGGASYSSGSASYGTGTANQGYNGGQDIYDNPPYPAGGGGGAGQVGQNPPSGSNGGNGGNGVQITTLANPTQTGLNGYYAGGGGGGVYGAASTATGGLGGGGNATTNINAITNTGGGGGGVSNAATGGSGGSGLVIIRYAI